MQSWRLLAKKTALTAGLLAASGMGDALVFAQDGSSEESSRAIIAELIAAHKAKAQAKAQLVKTAAQTKAAEKPAAAADASKDLPVPAAALAQPAPVAKAPIAPAAEKPASAAPPPAPAPNPPAASAPAATPLVLDPIAEVEARLRAEKTKPIPRRRRPVTENPTVAKVVDDLVRQGNGKIEAVAPAAPSDARAALFRLQQAEAAETAGDLIEAQRLAREARRLQPDNVQIGDALVRIEKAIRGDRLLTASHTRAKAHLAAGLSRGTELMNAGHYVAGESMLRGVVDAALLFPATENVGFYRRLAEKQIDQFHQDLRAGRIALPVEAGQGLADQPVLADVGVTTPKNLRRLLQSSEPLVPAWYSKVKNQLAIRVTVDYKSTPVALVFEELGSMVGVRFVIDEPVAIAGVNVSAMVDLRAGEVPAESVLDLACQQSGLEYVIMERAVVITTPAKAIDYLRELPAVVRNQWAAARILFPEVNTELMASPASQPLSRVEQNVPQHLTSGKSLVEEIQKLLR